MAKTNDSFAGAEDEARSQRVEALKAVAQYGRAGLELGAVAARELDQRTQATGQAQTQLGNRFEIPQGLREQLAQGVRATAAPYAQDNRASQAALEQEFGALSQGQDTYFGQVAEAVPALRAENQQIVEQYRQAYEERQAGIAADAAQKAELLRQTIMQQNMDREAMGQQSLLYSAQRQAQEQGAAAQLAALRRQTEQPAAPTRPLTMREKGYNPNTGRWER